MGDAPTAVTGCLLQLLRRVACSATLPSSRVQIRPAGGANVVLTTYEFLINKKDSPRLSAIKWHYLILDEGHRIKNADCQLSCIVRTFKIKHKLLLSGTPLQNQLSELWSLLNFLVHFLSACRVSGVPVVFPLIMPVVFKTLCKRPWHVGPKHVMCKQKGVNARIAGEPPL